MIDLGLLQWMVSKFIWKVVPFSNLSVGVTYKSKFWESFKYLKNKNERKIDVNGLREEFTSYFFMVEVFKMVSYIENLKVTLCIKIWFYIEKLTYPNWS
jgi:hypothetical protein